MCRSHRPVESLNEIRGKCRGKEIGKNSAQCVGSNLDQGRRFKSLSAAVCAITGAHWNGWRFFGLDQTGGAR
ncbi:DUF2924 domain-containing protein [Aquicoccus sp.]|uniref:DUF2924 domain-containing protein n=1 Tax=Aquicoccus sp. TaxID=2055851 RepID=UPI003561EB19